MKGLCWLLEISVRKICRFLQTDVSSSRHRGATCQPEQVALAVALFASRGNFLLLSITNSPRRSLANLLDKKLTRLTTGLYESYAPTRVSNIRNNSTISW